MVGKKAKEKPQETAKKERFSVTMDKRLLEKLNKYGKSKEFPIPRSQIIERATEQFLKKEAEK